MSASTLKLIMFVLMVMDHIFWYIEITPMWFTYLGRLVGPVFFFLLVESYFHTRNKLKFIGRLSVFSFISFLILQVMFNQPMNTFISMLLCVSILYLIDFIKEHKGSFFKVLISIIGIVILSILSLYTEWSYLGLIMTLIFYFLRSNRFLMAVAYCGISLFEISFAIGTPFLMEELFYGAYQWMMVFAIIPILLYNGKLGIKNKFFKYLFYVGYPLHLVILLVIGNTVNNLS